MSISIAVRVSYPEIGQYDWQDPLALYADVGAVEVAFYQTETFLEKLQSYHLEKGKAKLTADTRRGTQTLKRVAGFFA